MVLISNRYLALAATALVAVLFLAPSAEAHTWGKRVTISKPDRTIVRVHADRSHWRYRPYYRAYRDDVVVDAPATYVETRGRRTWVDAPFTSVRVHPRGVWVRAPFVNIYVPR